MQPSYLQYKQALRVKLNAAFSFALCLLQHCKPASAVWVSFLKKCLSLKKKKKKSKRKDTYKELQSTQMRPPVAWNHYFAFTGELPRRISIQTTTILAVATNNRADDTSQKSSVITY